MKRLLEKRKSNLFICVLFLMFFYVTTAGAITVINSNDSGPGSLRDAISQGGVIIFDINSIGPMINLSSPLLLDGFYGDVNIQGPGADKLAINGLFGDPSSLIQIGQGVNVQISGLTFANANAGIQYGAAISNAGNLRLSECLFSSNHAGNGGALYNGTGFLTPVASMDVFDCQFLGNLSDSGGAIYNDGNLFVESSDFTGNQAMNGNGGAIMNYGVAELTRCDLNLNTMTSSSMSGGGAIANYNTLMLDSCLFENNQALNNRSGGAIYSYNATGGTSLTGCTLRGNSAGSGGAIRNRDAENYHSGGVSLSLTNCLLAENQAYKDVGGAISSNADYNKVILSDCVVRDNTALTSAGGIYYGNNMLEMRNCTVSGNISQGGGTYPASTGGGGLYVTSLGSDVYLHNCTISGNVASSDMGYGGGGIYYNSSDSILKCINCTITDNNAATGAGISGRNIQLKNTVLAGNRGDDLYKSDESVSSYGYNLIGVVSRNGSTAEFSWEGDTDIVSEDIESADIFSGILADNEGPVVGTPGATEQMLTLALKSGSPAIDQAASTDIGGFAVSQDQRGVSRPQGSGYDIGAYELVPEPVYYSITTTSSAGGTIEPVSADVLEGTDKTFTVTVYDGYILGDLLDGDESVSADMVGSDCTFTNVKQDHTLTATFIIDPAMKEEAGVKDFQVEDEGIGSISQADLVREEDIRSLNMDGITSEDIQEYLGDEGFDANNFVSGVSFDVTYSNDEGNDIFALDVTLDISREDLGQDTCDAIDAWEDLAEAFFEKVSIYKIVSPDAYDLFTVASEDQDLAEPVNFFEVTGDEESYHVSMSMVIEDNTVAEGERAVEAVVSGLDNYFYVYDGMADGKFSDPLVAVRKSAVQEPPADDDDDVDDSDTTSEIPASSGGGNCNVGAFPAAFGLLMVPLLFLFRR